MINRTSATVTHKYIPRKLFMPFHMRRERFALIVAHRRAGKTIAVLNDMVIRALRTQKKLARYAYFAPYYSQAKDVVWAELKQIVASIPGVEIRESELSVMLPNGARIRLYGADNVDSKRGVYFDGVVCDEFGEWEGRAWTEVIRPALADRKGWAVFIGTPKGHNKFYEMREVARTGLTRSGKPLRQRWFYLELKLSETGYLSAEEAADMAEDMDVHERAQELECSFDAAIRGSYYGDHIQHLEARGKFLLNDLYDPEFPVSCAHDPGADDAWAIWFWQVIDGEVRFIDYWEETGFDAEEVLEVLDLRYPTYETMWLPHDALHSTARSKKSILDMFREVDTPARKVPDPDTNGGVKKNGINAVRKVLRTYPIVFDAVKCARGIEALKHYSRKWNADAKVFSEKAKHDEWSHGADAFRYACLSISPEAIKNSAEKAKVRAAKRAAGLTINTQEQEQWTFKDAIKARQDRLIQERSLGHKRI